MNTALFAALVLTIFQGILLLLATLWLAAGGTLRPSWVLAAAVAICLVLCAWRFGPFRWRNVTVLATGIACSALFCWATFDGSSDGNTYHIETLLRLLQGWNPIRDPAVGEKWIDLYPKANPILGALYYSVFGSVGFLRFPALLSALALMSWSYSSFREILSWNRGRSAAATAFIVLNPILVTQLASAYVDGEIYSASLCAFFAGIWFITKGSRGALVAMASALLLMVGLKFTGLVYAGAFTGAAILLAAVASVVARSRLQFKTATKQSPRLRILAITALTTVVVATCAIYENPYVENYRHYGNFFHPMPAYDWRGITPSVHPVLNGSVPPDLMPLNRFEKFVRVLHSKTQPAPVPTESVSILRMAWDEWPLFDSAEIRVGGFGPWFALALLLSIVAFFGAARRRRSWWIAGALAASFTLLTFLNPEAWWARYVPFFWLVPGILGLGTLETLNGCDSLLDKAIRGLAAAQILLLIANAVVISSSWAGQIAVRSWNIHSAIAQVGERTQSPVPLPSQFRKALEQRFLEKGIAVREGGSDSDPCFEVAFYGRKISIDGCVKMSGRILK